jgi:hypothetical protein
MRAKADIGEMSIAACSSRWRSIAGGRWLRQARLREPVSQADRTAPRRIARHQVTLEGLIARALSRSSTSRARLGARADQLVAEIRAQAANWSPNGVFTEVLTSSALIARRPDGG